MRKTTMLLPRHVLIFDFQPIFLPQLLYHSNYLFSLNLLDSNTDHPTSLLTTRSAQIDINCHRSREINLAGTYLHLRQLVSQQLSASKVESLHRWY